MKHDGLPIRIEPVRGRLPWKYSIHRPQVRVKPLFWCMCAGAAFWGAVWWVASR